MAMLSKLRKSCSGMLQGFSLPLYRLSIQISMVLSRGIFVNKESTSRLAMCKLGYCWQISYAKWNQSATIYSLVVEGLKIAVKTLLICR